MRNLLNAMWVSALYGSALVKYISPSSSFTLSASSSDAPPPPTTRASNWRCHKGVRGQCLFKVKLTLMFSSGKRRERGSSCSLLPPSDSQTGRLRLTRAELALFANFPLSWVRRRGALRLLFALLSLLRSASLCQPVKARGHAVGESERRLCQHIQREMPCQGCQGLGRDGAVRRGSVGLESETERIREF